MGPTLTLRQYVRRRTGVPLGHRKSMGNMLQKSLGASSFTGFWRHWNPIWSYGLGRFVHAPLRKLFPASLTLILTFAASGFIHDLVIMALRGEFALLFTPWFLLAGILALLSEKLDWDFGGFALPVRMGINLTYLAATFALAIWFSSATGLW